MDIETFSVGQVARLEFSFVKRDGRKVDPTTVAITITTPAGAESTYTYADDDIKRAAEGDYYFDQSVDSPGPWLGRVYSTGTGQGAQTIRFIGEP